MENWVKLRHECSPFEMFMKLRKGAEEDVRVRNQQLAQEGKLIFKVIPDNGTFGVSRELRGQPQATSRPISSDPITEWIDFSWDQSGIHVKDKNGKTIAEATLTLTDELDCKLKLWDGETLSDWQFRKRFLENLLFNF